MIEQHIHSLDIPYTILRPAEFFENFNWERAYILNGTFNARGLRPEKERQLISVEDIGVFAALALAKPEEYLGKTIELAGDALTESKIADTFTRVIGRPVKLTLPSGGESWGDQEEMTAMFNFFNGESYAADIPTLRKLHPGLITLEQYLRKSGWENAEPIPMPENSGWGR
jgi:uncharacterized protein YbjT (DUF2867 family)